MLTIAEITTMYETITFHNFRYITLKEAKKIAHATNTHTGDKIFIVKTAG